MVNGVGGGVIAILPNHLASLKNWAKKVASHAVDHYFVIISDARFIYYQQTKTIGVIAILPNPLASSKNWAKKVASHAVDHYFVTI